MNRLDRTPLRAGGETSHMTHRETEQEEKHRLELERLIEAVENGEIDAIEDLTREEAALFMTRARPEESLVDLFDRLRRQGPERS